MPDNLSAQDLTATRAAIQSSRSAQDRTILELITKKADLPDNQQKSAAAHARLLVDQIRKAGKKRHKQANSPEELLALYGKDHQHGLTLLELAAVLPDIPDAATQDMFIAEHLADHDWSLPEGQDEGFMMHATSNALSLARNILSEKDMAGRVGRPVIRAALSEAAHILADHFVLAENPVEALRRSKRLRDKGALYSLYLTSNPLRNKQAARDYFKRCANTVEALGLQDDATRNQVSVTLKLTALAPFSDSRHWQYGRRNLLERLHAICSFCARDNLFLILDAEASVRTDIMLDVLTYIAQAPDLRDWNGFGLTLQACDKGALPFLNHVIQVAETTGRIFPIRLTKGVLWSREMEYATLHEINPPPVFVDKNATDTAFVALAATILKARGKLIGHFATHDARAITQITEHARLAGNRQYEFQPLHGIGDDLRRQLTREGYNCRVIAPVGPHTTIMPMILDQIRQQGAIPGLLEASAKTTAPAPARSNTDGDDTSTDEDDTGCLPGTAYLADINHLSGWLAVQGDETPPAPAPTDAKTALALARDAEQVWQQLSTEQRATQLRKLGAEFETSHESLFRWLVQTAGLPWEAALNEIRLATRFCRETADSISDMANRPGTALHLLPRQPVASNPHRARPLSELFRVAAPAIVAGNAVIFSCTNALPPGLFAGAGIPDGILQPLSPSAMSDLDLETVNFHPGYSVMIADSSADCMRLAEDAADGAFHMSGQDNLAVRWLLVQDDIADKVMDLIAGRMDCIIVGESRNVATDMPPMIDRDAVTRNMAYIDCMPGILRHKPRRRFDPETGNFVLPRLVEIMQLTDAPAPPRGPVLHVMRWKVPMFKNLASMVKQTGGIRSVGIYSRIDAHITELSGQFDCDHLSINRNPALAENDHKPIQPQRFARIQKIHRNPDF